MFASAAGSAHHRSDGGASGDKGKEIAAAVSADECNDAVVEWAADDERHQRHASTSASAAFHASETGNGDVADDDDGDNECDDDDGCEDGDDCEDKDEDDGSGNESDWSRNNMYGAGGSRSTAT